MVLLQLAFTFLPVMNRFFHTAPLLYDTWERIALACAVFILLVEVVKGLGGVAPKRSV
jgi:hypothetical protein